ITPPFPEYPSGHSTQSGAAATVLTAFFGENFAFTDNTHEKDKLPNRSFKSFWDAAEEAGISRLYGGIHFRAAIDRGLDQGRCIGEKAVALRTRG
ncbi:MAG: phosphatase PAP2 family protein, partial [Devosia sp.]